MSPLAFFHQFGPMEWIVVLGAGLLLFGGSKLPQLGRSLGKGIVEFKKGLRGLEDEIEGGSPPPKDEELPKPPPKMQSPKFDAAE